MSNQSRVTDLSYLSDACNGNSLFIKEMITIFLKQTPDYLSELHDLMQKENWTEFRSIMHKLKPTISMIGIKKGEEYVKEIEKKVKEQEELDSISGLLNQLQKICEEAYIELEEELNRLKNLL